MKYLYTPQDVAVFFLTFDYPQSDERYVLREIWKSKLIPAKYRKDLRLFKQQVHLELFKHDDKLEDLDELNILMRDTEHAFCVDGSINEQGLIESYLKIIKLSLTYVEGIEYRRIKLRRLLKKFGYKRRSPQLVNYVQRTLAALGLRTYLRGYVPCDISEIDIDDMIIIRLKE